MALTIFNRRTVSLKQLFRIMGIARWPEVLLRKQYKLVSPAAKTQKFRMQYSNSRMILL